MKTINTKERMIIGFLREAGRSSTTSIAFGIKSDLLITKKYLNNLLKEGNIVKEEETTATYWKLKEGEDE